MHGLFSKSLCRGRSLEDGSCDKSPYLDLEGLPVDKESTSVLLALCC